MRLPAWLIASVVLVAACGVFDGSNQSQVGVSCENVPSGACQEQATVLTTGMRGVSDVVLQCRDAPPCTRAGGAGMAEIRLQNGQKLNRPWSYIGDAAPPTLTCLGVDRPLCLSYAGPEIDAIPPSIHVISVEATCTSAACTLAGGEMKVRIKLGDGSEQETSTAWSGGS